MTQTWSPDEQREHRKQWVEALRSGKYQQAKSTLRDTTTGGFCCLGVACDISGLSVWKDENYDGKGGTLPTSVQDWLGLESEDGSYSNSLADLATRNDKGASFAVLADLIESEPEGLIAKVSA